MDAQGGAAMLEGLIQADAKEDGLLQCLLRRRTHDLPHGLSKHLAREGSPMHCGHAALQSTLDISLQLIEELLALLLFSS